MHLPDPVGANVVNLQLGDEYGFTIYGEYVGSSLYRYYMTPYLPVDQFSVFKKVSKVKTTWTAFRTESNTVSTPTH